MTDPENRRQHDEDHDAIIRTDANVERLLGLFPIVRDHEGRIGRIEGRQNGAAKPPRPPEGFQVSLGPKALVAITTAMGSLLAWAKMGFPLPWG